MYEGPLDLLLDLIENAQLDITTVALAIVTDQYLKYLEHLQDNNAAEVSAFLVIAARLLQIKSAALLPRPSVNAQNDGDEEDPGEALARQLREYKRFKQLSEELKSREERGWRAYLRLAVPRPNIEIKPDLSDLTLEAFIEAARAAFAVRKIVPLDNVVNMPRVTIKDKIKMIVDRLRNKISEVTSFSSLLTNSTRVEIVVSFLAMLELIKQHMIIATQEERFGEITLHPLDELDQYQESEVEFQE